MPSSVDEAKHLSWDELNLVFALTHAAQIRAVVDHGDDVLRSELARWEPEERASMARALADLS